MIVLQTNLNRSKAAHDIAFSVAASENVDIIIACEPNIVVASSNRWVKDNRTDVAVYFRYRNLKVKVFSRNGGYVCLTIRNYRLYCCYCSPNMHFEQFRAYIDRLMNDVSTAKEKKKLVLGDLNVKSPEWGSPNYDNRGRYLSDLMATLNIVAVNKGDCPTFIRGQVRSFIDVTLATQQAARDVTNWKVLENEVLIDHLHIYFILGKENNRHSER